MRLAFVFGLFGTSVGRISLGCLHEKYRKFGHQFHIDSISTTSDIFKTTEKGIPASLFDKAKQLKTILFFKTGLLQVGILKKMFKSFKKLRVLDLRDAGIDEVPDSIGEMKELEYLDLSENGMKELPNSILKLSKLQTLKLYCCHSLQKLPKNFEKLKNLKHLDMRLCMALTCMPREMNKLTSLQTLSAFAVSEKDPRESLEELAKLTQLRPGYFLSRSGAETP